VTGLTLIDQLRKRTGYLTLQETSNLLGTHEATLRKWAKTRKIQALRIGDQIKFDPNVVADWLAARYI
jgi:excisionase family DNA binding protein